MNRVDLEFYLAKYMTIADFTNTLTFLSLKRALFAHCDTSYL